jgi:hypothetical protein
VPGYLTLAPELDAYRSQFERLADEADELTSTLSDGQFNWRPPSGRWSVAQCVDHLNVTARMYLPRLDAGIAEAIRRGLYGGGPFQYNWIGRLMVSSVAPPPRFRVKAPKDFQPAAARPKHETLAAFRAYQVQFIDRLRQANGLDLARARVQSPTAGFVRIPLGSAFELMLAHERRHLYQVRTVIAQPAFPAFA